ncbi:hypothetical protein ACWD7F_16180 [Streptomyces sp. NPDC005122]
MSRAVASIGPEHKGVPMAADPVKAAHRVRGHGRVAASLRTAAGSGAGAFAVAETVAGESPPLAMRAKETVARAFERTLVEGFRRERRSFHGMFATADQETA